MASKFLKKYFGIGTDDAQKRGDSAGNLPHSSAPSSTSTLPCYSSRRSSTTCVNRDSRSTSIQDNSRNQMNGKEPELPKLPEVHLCPHETLSFNRLRRIANLSGFRRSHDYHFSGDVLDLDAFTEGSFHRTLSKSTLTGAKTGRPARRCRPDPSSKFLTGSSNYHAADSDMQVELQAEWELDFDVRWRAFSSASELENFVEGFDVQLCPHVALSDKMIIEKIWRIINPRVPAADSLEEAEVNAWVKQMVNCRLCDSSFRVEKDLFVKVARVRVERKLGEGKDVADKSWLDQCVT